MGVRIRLDSISTCEVKDLEAVEVTWNVKVGISKTDT